MEQKLLLVENSKTIERCSEDDFNIQYLANIRQVQNNKLRKEMDQLTEYKKEVMIDILAFHYDSLEWQKMGLKEEAQFSRVCYNAWAEQLFRLDELILKKFKLIQTNDLQTHDLKRKNYVRIIKKKQGSKQLLTKTALTTKEFSEYGVRTQDQANIRQLVTAKLRNQIRELRKQVRNAFVKAKQCNSNLENEKKVGKQEENQQTQKLRQALVLLISEDQSNNFTKIEIYSKIRVIKLQNK